VERLTPEQIRLLEELRELRDSGILTVDEFEFQVAKVLGRPLVVEPSPVDEEPVEPDETVAEEIPDEVIREEQDIVNGVPAASNEAHEAELLEYEFDEPNVSDEDELLVEENQGVEPSSTSDISAAIIAESEIQQNKSSQRKILIGTTVSLALVAVIGLVALGGGKSDTTSSQIVDNTSTVTQSTTPVTTQAPTTSTTTTTEAIPTTTYEVLQCPYTRVIEAIDGKIVTPEGITFNLRPATYFLRLRDGRGNFREENGYQAGIEVENTTNFRLRIGMELEWSWPNGSLKVLWGPDNGRGWINGFDTRTIGVPDEVAYSQEPITDIQLKIVNATIKYLCP
jgi:cell division septation protein DedD